ncbi:MAG: 4a-hydroxytetrahydrobiopterin dehydratase [Chloroflexi bacterium]|nr:4a-hydroxytetrahydrobiopterin dehydratase [Chloroflexota bacterium]
MPGLADEQCAALSSGSAPASSAEVAELKSQVPDWTVVSDGMDKLERSYTFESFADALAFTGKVGAIAEEQGHHPQLTTEWGRTTVRWWTHVAGGLHRNDFIMAAKTDALAQA